MDLSTTYLGLKLPHPFMPGASPLVNELDMVKRLEDAGAAAIVMNSLFEEQIRREQLRAYMETDFGGESRLDAVYYAPRRECFARGPEEYLEHLARIKSAVAVPVVGSLNGTTLGGWLEYAKAIEHAGADALELNVYALPTELDVSGQAIEDRTIEMVRAVRAQIRIPLAVKLSPFYTAPIHFARRLTESGADGLVLFNRFYQPDVNPDSLGAQPHLDLSTAAELPLRLHWLALLSGRVHGSLIATGGVTGAVDALKALMCGAHAVQLVSALVRHGPEYLARVRRDATTWMEEHGYESIQELRGSMNLTECPDMAAYERAHYMLTLQSLNAH